MRRAFYAFSAFIVISFLALGGVLNYLAHNYIHQTTDDKVIRDLEILATITQGAIAHSDYERIEEQVLLWGEKDPNIIAVRVILDGDSPIVEFARETQTSDILRHERTVSLFTGRSVTFEILYDLAEHKRNTLVFAVIFFSLSGCVAVGFIFSLWMLLHRLAIFPLQQEISQRLRAEKALRSERTKAINILDSIEDGVYIVNRQYEIEYVNPILKEEFGAVEKRKCYEYFHNREEVCPWCKNPEVFAGKTVRWEWYSPKNQRTYDLIDTPLKNPDGSIISKLEIFRDISERKQAEKELRRANRALKTFSECNQAVVRAREELHLLHEICRIIVDIGGYRLAWVGFAKQDEAKTVQPVAQAGYEEGYLDKLNITWADTKRGRGPTGTAIRSGEPIVVKNILNDPNYTPWRAEASKRGYESAIALPLISDGQAFGTLNIYAEEPDAFDAEEIKLLMELADDLAYGIMALRTLSVHKQAEEELSKYRDHLEELVQERTNELEEKTGKIEESRKALTYLLEDVNEARAELESANKKLKELDRLKSQFLANMSHELRTPLNSIIGFTGIILQGIVGELNDEQKKQLNMVYGSAKHLLELINDILDLSKIEAGKIEIIPAEFEIKELIQMVEKMVSPMIEEKGLAFEVAISEDVPPTIYNDKNRIKQVLINLLSNAIKFTESGKITLNAEYSISDFGLGNADLRNSAHFIKNDRAKRYNKSEIRIPHSEIQFSVADTGIGIKPEHVSEVFDEFKQIEGPLKEKPTGTGLGLAISKKMVEMMGGRIWVETEYGKGSCFQFAIPVKEIIMAKRPPAIAPEALDLTKKLIMTIDDDIEAQEILKTYLKSEGYEVIQAYNAMEAMELAKKYRPFAITLDIIMPGKDGWDILQDLKKKPLTERIPVICISILDNREMGLSLGAFEYLVKPIEKDQFIKEIKRLEKRFKIYDILIVDDEPQAVELLAQYLGGETNNYRVTKAYGGKEGLAVVKERRPDLIVLDLMMPEIDGFEVIRRLKESKKTKEIPIIIVSAKKLTQEEVEYLNRNIEKIIRKGDFSKEDLLKDIKRALEEI